MTDPNDDKNLKRALSDAAAPVSRTIRTHRGKHALYQAVARVLPLVVVIPGIYALFSLCLRSVGADFRPSLWWIVGASIGYPASLLIAFWRRGLKKKVPDRLALAAIDDELHLNDRLSAAHEFLAADERSSFMEAAIEDARQRIDEAKKAEIAVAAPTLSFRPKQALWLGAAVLLIAIGAAINVQNPSVANRSTSDVGTMAENEVIDLNDDKQKKKRREKTEQRKENPLEDRKASGRKNGGSDETPAEKKASKGKVGLGKSAQAQSAGGQSSGEGAASAQAQPTKGGAKKKPKKQPTKKKDSSNKKNKPQGSPPDEKESVASAGRGRGKGASRSPTASDWSSKDQIVSDEDEEFDEDEDIDDDEEESDARGGVQPNLRQRKPPVNRDLNIGFGGGKPPPFANGRGGPGLPKKQRGVAQLILGVPFPDQITGQPNPGMTKVTQERIEPQATDAKKITAEARKARATPIGQLKHRVLKPWMQDLVREFYGHLINQAVKE
ncbi:MAG: hypothetical protein ACI97A_003530 [Planctomycetota bacterium]|jgi:hypothetical protein